MVKAPFPYFGGKASVADVAWRALGQPKHYIEPFFGSGAVLLNRPNYDPATHVETVNDKDGHIANVWRALQADPDAVAKVCDWPVNLADLSARKSRLLSAGPGLLAALAADDKYYDVELAGCWIWASSCWIGAGLTSLGGIPNISDAGQGVHRIGKVPHICDAGKGVQEPYNTNIYEWFRQLSERLRYVRVVCGDWIRVCGGNWQAQIGPCGMFFDPPYSDPNRYSDIYHEDSMTVATEVAKWAYQRAGRDSCRIVLAGYYGEHEWLLDHGWRVHRWSARGGYGNLKRSEDGEAVGKYNRHREALFMSPNCELVDRQMGLFD